MLQEERVPDKRHEWDCISAGWPEEIREVSRTLFEIEDNLSDMVEVATQQTISRCKLYTQNHGYPFTTFQLNIGLIFFNRAVEELAMQGISVSERAVYRDSLNEAFLRVLDETFHKMRTDEQRARIRENRDYDRFPGDIIGMALIERALRHLARYLARVKEENRVDYFLRNRGILLELLNMHVTRLKLGKEIC